MTHKFIDYFLILEVHYLASDDVIKAAYKRLAHKHHPDRGGNRTHFQLLNTAYDTLADAHKKRKYMVEWLSQHGQVSFDDKMKGNFHGASFDPIIKALLKYLEAIRDENYEKAYFMLSQENQKRIFMKDFIQWQKLISEIHKLLEFECVIEGFYNNGRDKTAQLKVKVKEYNHLLHRSETDFFYRELIHEFDWKIHLKNYDIRSTIRKYKKILAVNRKMSKQLPKLLHDIDENHSTRYVSKKYFINNCEYEWLRFQRYGRYFCLISIQSEDAILFQRIEKLLEVKTRQLDSYCLYHKQQYFILLPETNKANGMKVITKLTESLSLKERSSLKFRISMPQEKYNNVKEMLDRLK